MVTPFALIDMLVLLPAYIGLFGGIDVRTLRVLRLLRLLKLARYSRSMFLLWDVICEEARAIGASAFVLGILLIVASSVAYLFEHPAQPEAFSSIPQAMWWAIVTMTTVGYGDVTPVTIAGKVIAAIVSIVGIGMVALPAGLIAAGFVNRLHGTSDKPAPAPDPAPDVNAGYLEHIMARLEQGLRELSLAERIAGETPADAERCPHCGAPLSGSQPKGHGGPSSGGAPPAS
jgi:voltage-gated potassium channel